MEQSVKIQFINSDGYRFQLRRLITCGGRVVSLRKLNSPTAVSHRSAKQSRPARTKAAFIETHVGPQINSLNNGDLVRTWTAREGGRGVIGNVFIVRLLSSGSLRLPHRKGCGGMVVREDWFAIHTVLLRRIHSLIATIAVAFLHERCKMSAIDV